MSEQTLVHCPKNSGPTLDDISWVVWEYNDDIDR